MKKPLDFQFQFDIKNARRDLASITGESITDEEMPDTKEYDWKEIAARKNHEIIDLKEENTILHTKVEKLQAFKDYVHQRLDDAGIEKEPNRQHSKHGCRIGDRLDIALRQPTDAEQSQKLICPNCENPYPHTKPDGTHYCEECWMSWAH